MKNKFAYAIQNWERFENFAWFTLSLSDIFLLISGDYDIQLLNILIIRHIFFLIKVDFIVYLFMNSFIKNKAKINCQCCLSLADF